MELLIFWNTLLDSTQSLKAEKTGIAILILSKPEIDVLSQHVKTTTENLLKLYPKTPESFIFLVSGSMPDKTVLHMRQLSLFSMICRLPGNILINLARQILLSDKKELTLFDQIESACYQYALPHHLQLL